MSTLDEQLAAAADPGARETSQVEAAAAGGNSLLLPPEVIGQLGRVLAERARSGEPVRLTGPGGLLTGLMGQVLQAGLAAELDAHLGYSRGGRGRERQRELPQRGGAEDDRDRGRAAGGRGAAGPGGHVRAVAAGQGGAAQRRH